jgi:hypothetical protein
MTATNPGSPLSRLIGAYQDALALNPDDLWVVDTLLSVLLGTLHPQLRSESLWLRIVGPPSCGKTECVRPLRPYPACLFVSSMTDNSLISGHRDDTNVDPSLILQLNNKVLVIKDLTDLLCHSKTTTQKVFGDLRDAYDGECSKASGINGLTTYESRFGIIACVTDVVDTFPEFTQQLGERFLTIRMSRTVRTPDQAIQFLEKVQKASSTKLAWEARLRTEMVSVLDTLVHQIPAIPLATLSDHHSLQVRKIAYLIAQLRTTPINGTSVDAEVGARISNQFLHAGLAHAFADNRTEWDESDTILVRRLALDTLIRDRRKLVLAMYGSTPHSCPMSISQICQLTGRPAKEIDEIVAQYTHIGVTRKLNKIQFILSEKIRAYINDTKLFLPGEHYPSMSVQFMVPQLTTEPNKGNENGKEEVQTQTETVPEAVPEPDPDDPAPWLCGVVYGGEGDFQPAEEIPSGDGSEM